LDILKSINISGPNGGFIREHDYIFEFTRTVSSIINLDKHSIHLDIVVHPSHIRDYPDAIGLCYEKDENRVEIHLARKCVEGSSNDLYTTLTHELLHARQTCLGERMYERPVQRNEEFIYQLAKEKLEE
jgi:hypothetical protein